MMPGVGTREDAMDRDKLLYRRDEAIETLGIGATRLQELLAAGRLKARRYGKTVLIEGDSLRAFITSLPAAKVGNNPPVRRPKEGTRNTSEDTPSAA
jgi:excisionase family DNA binding protein